MRLIDAERIARKLPKKQRKIVYKEKTAVDLNELFENIDDEIVFINNQKKELLLRNNLLDSAKIPKLALLNGKLEILNKIKHNLLTALF